jgi:hypothetical protein
MDCTVLDATTPACLPERLTRIDSQATPVSLSGDVSCGASPGRLIDRLHPASSKSGTNREFPVEYELVRFRDQSFKKRY